MKSIVLIVPYMGSWPLWFEAHLVSIAQNPTIDWLFITDCETPSAYPENVQFVTSSLPELKLRIRDTLGVDVPLTPRKLCDVRPAFGRLFQQYIQDYDFWGFCDLDIIWGDIRKFVTGALLEEYHIISSRRNSISGHFTLFRNAPITNTLYIQIPAYSNLLLEKKLMRVDEEAFTVVLKNLLKQATPGLKIYWNTYLMNQTQGKAQQEYYLDKWLWKEGKMLEIKNGKPIDEVMYLHFINWKRTLKYSEVRYNDEPKQFLISYNGMHYFRHSDWAILLNSIKNWFNGYEVRMRRKKLFLKLKGFKKRLFRKLTKK